MIALKERYESVIRPAIMTELGVKNTFEVPQVSKVVLNMSSGEGAHDARKLAAMIEDMTAISGQKPVVTKSKNSIAGFKIREGMNLGVKVTLRRERMYEFLDRLLNIALPRVRDFRGLSTKSFDGRGNYSLGIKEQIIFPEINYDKVDKVRGFDITVCTTARNDHEAMVLLKAMNFPFLR